MIDFAEAKKSDIPGMVEVMRNTGYADFAYKGKTDSEIEKDISKSKNTYLICYEKKPSQKRKIVGYFVFSSVDNHLAEAQEHIPINNQYAFHLGIGIHSDYRGKKLAKKLTEYALSKAKKEGFKGMYADVASDNTPSLKLQESTGFEKILEHDSKERKHGVKDVVFVKHF